MYAIIRDRGQQYRVEPGQTLQIALTDAEDGSKLEFNEVLMVGGDSMIVGAPLVAGALVTATVGEMVKGEKLIVFRYKSKNRYRRRTGHRQKYTAITINDIVLPNSKHKDNAEA
ncbi:MAG: 50S ribosomal protein L21 [Herpetosiphon sp.]|nr:50S ribosomal protein L21 [Herpetosiphon sp.]